VLFPQAQISKSESRVVITGAGIVTAMGMGWRANADGFRVGRRCFRPVSAFDVSQQRCKVAAEVALPDGLPPTLLARNHQKRLDRAAKMLLYAAHEAWSQARCAALENLRVVLGTTSGGMELGEAYLRQALSTPTTNRRQPSRVIHYNAHQPALNLCDAFGFNGSITVIANACASGSNAIGHAFELVRNGVCDSVIAGGYDALSLLTFAGFDSLQALSVAGCRPFDAHRDGLTLGEGAAVLALESLEQALDRDAEILGEIIGYGTATDNHHITQPHPEGDGALRAIVSACNSAGILPSQVDYVNAHGTGTPQNDSTEASAINRWAGQSAANLYVSSTKACVGHLLGAAGAAEAVVSLMALKEGWLPPEREVDAVDETCQFRLVREPMEHKVRVVLSNSFGFGGANAALAFRRWE
jgi:3-oxoacyl-[acyl-carrier-protein] synthase II